MVKKRIFETIITIFSDINDNINSEKKASNYDQLDINKFLISIPHTIDEITFSKTFEKIERINC